ncbi:MAG: hypothetical protein FJX77_02790 [Armatimonadetes bacterium]|nr:hypothetical protein [Armatimonadota bacterium]
MRTHRRARLPGPAGPGGDQQARAEQAARIEEYGGVEAVLRRGTFDNSPVPGEKSAFRGGTDSPQQAQ